MGHMVQIRDREHFIEALGILNDLPGMWHARGNPSAPTLYLTDVHYRALIKAGVISKNGKGVARNGETSTAKKNRT